MKPLARMLDGLVLGYQWTLASLLGGRCRFHPSCSTYAREAIATHGALRGVGLAGWRILRCNPWCNGGYDPVPGSDRADSR